jgi:hypothetical protein
VEAKTQATAAISCQRMSSSAEDVVAFTNRTLSQNLWSSGEDSEFRQKPYSCLKMQEIVELARKLT